MLPGALLAATGVLVTGLDPATGLMAPGLGPADFASPRPVQPVRTAGIPLAALLLVDASAAGAVVRTAAAGIAGQLRPPVARPALHWRRGGRAYRRRRHRLRR